jgi:serine-type D-Ala-D-Ala carboxypeptidase/endopeptidase (penicillin-binding protein 4)
VVASRWLVVALSICARVAWSQGVGSAGSAANPDTDPVDDEDSAAGSANTLVAPGEAKARAVWLKDKLAAAISSRPTLAKAKIGVAVAEVSAGSGANSQLFAHEADKGMGIASATKLLTSVAALGTLGGGYRWRTAAYVDDLDDATGVVKGDLYVRGRGDPSLSVADLRALAADVAARGVRQVDGQLVVDATYFDTAIEPPHYAEQPKERAGFRAPVASFGVARSAVTVTVIGEPGANAKVELDPDAGEYVRVAKSEVKTVKDGRTKIKIDAKPKADHLDIEVSGQIRLAGGSYDTRKRIDDPARFAAEVFRKALADKGVRIARHAIGSATVPATAKLIASHDSAPLAMIVREMNKLSDNYVAESVLKTLGAETRATPGPASWADGVAAVQAYLGKIGLPAGSYRADNGSGLFGASEVSAQQLVTLLRAAWKDWRIGPDLVASLPVGGVDGTLAKRWHGHKAKGLVRAKTGTLDKVTALTGFVGVDAGHMLAFAIIVNEIPAGQRGVSRAMADDMVDAMIAYLEAGSASR